jgi:hypothetical protein
MKHIFALVLFLCMWSEGTHAMDREQQRGKALLQELCGGCHAIGQTSEVPIPLRRHSEILARTSFTTTTLDNGYRMA